MEIRKKEGFPKQRLVVVPANVIERCHSLPVVNNLFVTDIGAYPSAPLHFVERPNGVEQAILICCLSGNGQLKIESSQHSIKRGGLFVIPPGTPHTYWADDKSPWSLFWIHFGGRQVNEILQSLGVGRNEPCLFVPDLNQVRKAFEDVYACLNYHYSDNGLLAMTSELLRLICTVKLCEGHIEPKKQSTEKRVLETIEFMNQHLNMLLTLKELANHSGQSVSYYSRVFKEKTGQSPLNYFLQLKIKKACELLDQTELNIGQVAAELGYDDRYYFSRLFKKIQGIAPVIYRKQQKG
jgi:AraC-like DNA-binding protein